MRQQKIWVATKDLPRSRGCPFYERLNRILDKAGFDEVAEELCVPFHAERRGRPGLPPGNTFRMLLVGFFEDHDPERRIAWHIADSLSLLRTTAPGWGGPGYSGKSKRAESRRSWRTRASGSTTIRSGSNVVRISKSVDSPAPGVAVVRESR